MFRKNTETKLNISEFIDFIKNNKNDFYFIDKKQRHMYINDNISVIDNTYLYDYKYVNIGDSCDDTIMFRDENIGLFEYISKIRKNT